MVCCSSRAYDIEYRRRPTLSTQLGYIGADFKKITIRIGLLLHPGFRAVASHRQNWGFGHIDLSVTRSTTLWEETAENLAVGSSNAVAGRTLMIPVGKSGVHFNNHTRTYKLPAWSSVGVVLLHYSF